MRQLGADSNAEEKDGKMYGKNFEGATFWLNNQQDENEILDAHPISSETTRYTPECKRGRVGTLFITTAF